jgi:group I intron endonuclease
MILNITPEDKIEYFNNKSKGGLIYKIKNLINEDFYIGSTQNLNKRYYTHLNHIRTNKNTCVKLIRAVNKYGEENFSFEIIEKCNVEDLLNREQYYLDFLNPKYNISKKAGSNLGIKRTEETKLKKSISQKENWSKEEYRKNHLENLSKNWKKGSNHKMAKITEEDVMKIKLKLKEGLSAKEVSNLLNLSYHSVKDIQRNKTWKHVKI